MKNNFIDWIKNFLINLPFTIFAIVFFVFSNPNYFFNKGFGLLAFLIFIPVLICVHKSNIKTVWLHGFIFGAFSYGFYAYWIIKSYPEFIPVIYIGYGLMYSVLFLLLKLLDSLFKKNGWVSQWLLICCFDFIKTFGFLGNSYGIIAYTQWKNTYFIQIVDVIGVYGLNAIIVLFSAIIYSFIQKAWDKKIRIAYDENNIHEKKINLSEYLYLEKELKNYSNVTTWISFVIWFFAFIGCYVYGFLSVKDYSTYETRTIAAVQNNENSWLDGIDVYTKNIKKLLDLTDEALELNPEIDLVVWPETSVVPAIVDNYFNPIDERRENLVKYILNFINSKDCDFIVGNGHKATDSFGQKNLYNSALYFVPKKNVVPPNPVVYSKIKLVPLSEYFPYKKVFPHIYKALKKRGLLNWEKGNKIVTFKDKNWEGSALICFEDTFTDLSRKHYKNGSRCFFCISNDSWSKSVACQNQHLSIALFRSIENRIPSVRSTASGNTCVIDPNGKIISSAPEFCESFIIEKIPVIPRERKATFYSKYGDVAGWVEIFSLVLLLIIQSINVIIKKRR